MDILVGYTGFVGSNIASKHEFDMVCNSKNISEAFGLKPEFLVYAGIRAEMFTANKYPEKDKQNMDDAIENIRKIAPKRIALISTISVYGDNAQGDEDSFIDEGHLSAYGRNRLYLENEVRKCCEDTIIIRLPALYGKNIKKNFIYDYLNIAPGMLNEAKYKEVVNANEKISDFYRLDNDGFYRLIKCNGYERKEIKKLFDEIGFSALNFTDSRSQYQFYNLSLLWDHIRIAVNGDLECLNMATEPVSVGELYKYLEDKPFVNELSKAPYKYDFRTKHAELFGGDNGYIFSKGVVLKDIKDFCEEYRKENQ